MNVETWFKSKRWTPLPFQENCWDSYDKFDNCLLNAPTGSGKTYAVFWAWLSSHLSNQNKISNDKGFRLIWISPLRALSHEIELSIQQVLTDLELPYKVMCRTGDSSSAERRKILTDSPQILVTTPESLHLMLSNKNSRSLFNKLECIVADEWHELMGSKRGTMTELAFAKLKDIRPNIKCWGISATIGNLGEALEVLAGNNKAKKNIIIQSDIKRETEIISVYPDEAEAYPSAGHSGIKLSQKVIDLIHQHKTTLIFTNTRAQAEIWYQELLNRDKKLIGLIALHHGSLSREERNWVEEALHNEKLKAVVCTSSLDLGVDFRPVDNVIQTGGPKGIARFLQRAGRSRHQPYQKGKIYFVPSNSLELIEAAALRSAISEMKIENRNVVIEPYDVLMQFLVTLGLSEAFKAEEVYKIVTSAYAFKNLDFETFREIIFYLEKGGKVLNEYDEYKKLERTAENTYAIKDKRVAMRHRMQIGVITENSHIKIRFLKGGYLGSVEENFISQLKAGDIFRFSGRSLEFVKIKNMEAFVRNAGNKKGVVPRWAGGRMPLSSQLADFISFKLENYNKGEITDPEITFLKPILERQKKISAIPCKSSFLMEYCKTREGFHLFAYPFEGRMVHESIALLLAWRISLKKAISFSVAVNDYGLEILSDLDFYEILESSTDLFSSSDLTENMQKSINAAEIARRKFRSVATICGWLFKGYPGKSKATKHLQSSASLLFNVFHDYDPENLMLKQAYREAFDIQIEEDRLRQALFRIENIPNKIVKIKKPGPFAFPIMVDRLRESLSSEKLEDRIEKMRVSFEKN
ncbi:MAG: ligase-associated DNA damage response DEXH box helicase [Chitinophagaceae bacterium]|nr:MAG: ligase-associated DNA damage response DEXH box helicase [Chitinophagaceae bacterium]